MFADRRPLVDHGHQTLPLKRFQPPAETARARREAQGRATMLDLLTDEGRQTSTTARLAAVTDFHARQPAATVGWMFIEHLATPLAGAKLMAVPANAFVPIGLRPKQGCAQRLFPGGLAYGSIGYFPKARTWPAGGYEVVSAAAGAAAEEDLAVAAPGPAAGSRTACVLDCRQEAQDN